MLKKTITLLGMIVALSGCEESMHNMQDGLNKYDNFISGKALPAKKQELPAKKTPLKNFGISDAQAMTYLTKDEASYLMKPSKWIEFWSYHIHLKTQLFKKAEKFCDVKLWEFKKTSENCGNFHELIVLVRGNEMTSQDFGH